MMASLVDELKTEYQKYKKEDTLGTLFQFLEMALCTYEKLTTQQNDWDKEEKEEEAIFDEQWVRVGEEEKEDNKKGILRIVKTTKKEKNERKGGRKVRKQSKGSKKREEERQRGKKGKEKNKQERKGGRRSLNGGKQDLKKKSLFRDNG